MKYYTVIKKDWNSSIYNKGVPIALNISTKYKVAGYKINEYRLKALVYTNNSMAKKKLVKTVPFRIMEKKLKYA